MDGQPSERRASFRIAGVVQHDQHAEGVAAEEDAEKQRRRGQPQQQVAGQRTAAVRMLVRIR